MGWAGGVPNSCCVGVPNSCCGGSGRDGDRFAGSARGNSWRAG